MPPLDWSIVQSILLSLVLPSLGIAAGLLMILLSVLRTESQRSMAVSIAFMAGLFGGLAVQNSHGELIPFLAIERIIPDVPDDLTAADNASPKPWESWKFETGWRSVFSVTLLAVIAEMVVESAIVPGRRPLLALSVRIISTIACALWLVPWDEFHSRPWGYVLLSLVMLANGAALRQVGSIPVGRFVAIVLAIVWGGSSTALMVLAHSARFGDLAMLFSCALVGVGAVMLFHQQTASSLYAGPATFVPGLMLAGQLNTYSDIPSLSFWLIAIAPGPFLVLFWPGLGRWLRAHPQVLLLYFIVPCVIAVALAIRAEF